MPILYEGEIPIIKNINVIDEKGNNYEATYPKRARGLVKNGRARFVDENTICLACPPNNNLEDNYMNNDIFNPDTHKDTQIPPIPPIPPIPEIPPIPHINAQGMPLVVGSVQFGHDVPPAHQQGRPLEHVNGSPLVFNMEYVLSRIDIILKDTSYIHKALDTIVAFQPSESEASGGMSDLGRAEAVTAAVQSRETTNQQMLKLLEKMYDDLKPKEKSVKDRAFDMAERTMCNSALTPDEKVQLLDVLNSIRHIDN
ncbi:MAG: hypothetical protein AB9835_01245 [Eubacteriales bacterium]